MALILCRDVGEWLRDADDLGASAYAACDARTASKIQREYPQARVVVGSLEALPFERDRFDLVVTEPPTDWSLVHHAMRAGGMLGVVGELSDDDRATLDGLDFTLLEQTPTSATLRREY